MYLPMFIEQAFKGDNAWWKVMITTLVSGGIFFLNILVFLLIPDDMLKAVYEMQPDEPSILNFVATVIPFAFLLGLLFLLVRYLHDRSIRSLTTVRPRFSHKRFWLSFSVVIAMTLLMFWAEYASDPASINWSLNLPRFLIFLALSLLLLPTQIGFEEYFFRGYLMQQMGVWAGTKWLPLIATSLFFGLCHAANPEIIEMGPWLLVYYISTGLLLGIMTLMDEGLELSLGYHFGNNLIASLLISYDHAALQTETLFRYASDPDPSEMLQGMLISTAIAYPLILLLFARVFKWKNWKEKLFGKVSSPAVAAPQSISYENTSL